MAKIQRRVIDGKKECTRCKENLTVDKFYFKHDRYSSMCKVCVRQRAVENAKNCSVCGILTTNYLSQEDGTKKCYKCARKESRSFKVNKKRELVKDKYLQKYLPVANFVDRMIERDFTTYTKMHTIRAVNDIITYWTSICRRTDRYDELPMSDQITCMIEDLKSWRQNDYKEPE